MIVTTASGYWQVEVREEDSLSTSNGHYEFNKMPD
jgi:hypothetical protein